MRENAAAWERQPKEPARAYHAFCHYRDGGPARSGSKAWRAHKKDCDGVVVSPSRERPKRWSVWSVEFSWQERAGLWDAEIDRQAREKYSREQVDAKARHARIAQGGLTVLTAPIRAMLDAMSQEPEIVKRLTSDAKKTNSGALSLIGLVSRVVGGIQALVAVERLALGLTTESVEVDDKRESESDFAALVGKDPAATDLAIQLLDRIAGTGASVAERPGAPGQPGQVADGTTSQPSHP